MLLTILANNVMIAPVVPPPPTPDPISGGGGSYAPSRYTWEQQEEDRDRERIKKNNEFILEFLKTATDIVNNQ